MSGPTNVRAICLTHGHEDHIGALPFVLQELNVPVYGTALTLGLVTAKLEEYKLDGSVELVTVKPRDTVSIGCFQVEFLRVAHSIVDGCALAITSPEGVVIHTGDFKIDHTPVDGQLTDLASLSRYGEAGVLALLSDSTNVEREGYTLSEKYVGEAFAEIFPKCCRPDHRGRLLQQHPPRAAGGRRRRPLRPQDPAERPLNGEKRADRPGSRLSDHRRRAC